MGMQATAPSIQPLPSRQQPAARPCHLALAAPTPDLELLRQLLAGDERAGTRFFERFRETVELSVRQAIARMPVRDRQQELQDVCHDVWLALWERDKARLRRFDPSRGVQLSTWIARVARNRAIDRMRCYERRIARRESDGALRWTADVRPLPPEQIDAQRKRELARRALDRLRDRDRDFLASWYVEERCPGELARELGVALTTVYTRRCKIQKRLARTVASLQRAR